MLIENLTFCFDEKKRNGLKLQKFRTTTTTKKIDDNICNAWNSAAAPLNCFCNTSILQLGMLMRLLNFFWIELIYVLYCPGYMYIGPTFINFELFSRAYGLLKGPTFIKLIGIWDLKVENIFYCCFKLSNSQNDNYFH